jgi:septum formation protein
VAPETCLILASKSPRRYYLLKKAGLAVEVHPSGIDESSFSETEPADTVLALARAKTLDVAARYPTRWVLGADTVVNVDDRILGKPATSGDARAMLTRLSGKTHQVFTGFCICRQDQNRFFSDTVVTDVTFKTLSEAEIDWYIRSGEPFDKAGAYAIQGIGTFLVRSINGSYTNVVGLPVCEVIEILIREGVMALEETVHHSHYTGEG